MAAEATTRKKKATGPTIARERNVRATGSRIVLIDNRGDEDGKPWIVECRTHRNKRAGFEKWSDARRVFSHPQEFCAGCRKVVEETEAVAEARR